MPDTLRRVVLRPHTLRNPGLKDPLQVRNPMLFLEEESWKEIQKNYLVPNRRKKWQAAAAGDVNACSPWKHMAGSLLWPSLFRRILSPFWALKQYPCLFCLEEYFL